MRDGVVAHRAGSIFFFRVSPLFHQQPLFQFQGCFWDLGAIGKASGMLRSWPDPVPKLEFLTVCCLQVEDGMCFLAEHALE